MSSSEESLNSNILKNDLMAKKRGKLNKRLKFILSIVLIGIIYGYLFGFILSWFLSIQNIFLLSLFLSIIGGLISLAFALTLENGR